LEEEISLVCLRFFHGDWDLYLDYLTGPRVSEQQRRRELPVVERLKDRDRRTDFLTATLEDEIVSALERLDFEALHRVWELCLLSNPAVDPFQKSENRPAKFSPPSEDPPASVH
jgi:hypothetical protein